MFKASGMGSITILLFFMSPLSKNNMSCLRSPNHDILIVPCFFGSNGLHEGSELQCGLSVCLKHIITNFEEHVGGLLLH